MDELIRLLDAEVERLAWVNYRTVVAVLLLRNEEARFLTRAVDEIDDQVDRLEQVDYDRVVAATHVADELGLPASATLEDIIGAVPWSAAGQLRERQRQLRTLQAELQELTQTGTAVAATKLDAIRRSLGRWGSVANSGYGVAPPSEPSSFDGVF